MGAAGHPSPASTDIARARNADAGAVALVVGGSRGIGLAFARELLGGRFAGRVVVTGRNPAEAAGLVELQGEHPTRLSALPLDVTDEGSVAAAAKSLQTGYGRVDLVLNTAGILHGAKEGPSKAEFKPERALREIDPEWMIYNFRVNAVGPMLLAKHLQPLLETKRKAASGERAASVFATLSARVGSIGDNRLGGWYSYRVSKAAQNQLTRTAALELKRGGCIAVALHPGTVDTDLSEPFQASVKPEKLFAAADSARMLLDVVDSLEISDTGSFFDYARVPVPW